MCARKIKKILYIDCVNIISNRALFHPKVTFCFFIARHPGLLALWTDSPHVSNKVKWILFLETVYDFVPLKFHLWTQIPNRLVLVTASLRFFKVDHTFTFYKLYYCDTPYLNGSISDIFPLKLIYRRPTRYTIMKYTLCWQQF